MRVSRRASLLFVLGVLGLAVLLSLRLLVPDEPVEPHAAPPAADAAREPAAEPHASGAPVLPGASPAAGRDRTPEPIRTAVPEPEPAASGTAKARVIDRAGSPVGNAVLYVHQMHGQGLLQVREPLPLSAQSGADGTVHLTRLPLDLPLGVQVRSPDHAPSVRETFRVQAGRVQDLGDIVVEPGFPLAGRVTDGDGTPIEAAEIALAELGFLQGGDPRPVLAVTDSDGRYRVEHLGSRQYSLEARAVGYASDTTVLSFMLGGVPAGQSQDFVLLAADQQLAGFVLGPDDGPVPGCTLTASRRDPGRRTYAALETVSDARGAFRFEALAAQPYQLDLRSPTHYLPKPLRVESGRLDLAVRVQRGLAVSGTLVCDAEPPSRFDIRILPDGSSGAGLLPGGGPERQVRAADPPGSFRIDGLRPGSYRFEVRAEGWAVTTSSEVILGHDGGDAELLVHLLRGGTLRGRVDPPTPDLSAELRGADYDPALALESLFPTAPVHALVAPTAADGGFRLEHVPPGEYTLSLRGGDRPPVHVRDLQLEEGQTLDIGTLALPLGGTLFGNVHGPDGRPRSGVRVTATSDGHHQETVSDASGAFRMTAVPEGDYLVVAVPSNLWEALRLEARVSVTLRPRDELPILLAMTERAQVPR